MTYKGSSPKLIIRILSVFSESLCLVGPHGDADPWWLMQVQGLLMISECSTCRLLPLCCYDAQFPNAAKTEGSQGGQEVRPVNRGAGAGTGESAEKQVRCHALPQVWARPLQSPAHAAGEPSSVAAGLIWICLVGAQFIRSCNYC